MMMTVGLEAVDCGEDERQAQWYKIDGGMEVKLVASTFGKPDLPGLRALHQVNWNLTGTTK